MANADQFWSTTPEAFVHGTAASHDATGKLKFVWKAAQPTKNQGDKSVPDNLRTYFLWVQVQSAEVLKFFKHEHPQGHIKVDSHQTDVTFWA